jgi:hypothetical protein
MGLSIFVLGTSLEALSHIEEKAQLIIAQLYFHNPLTATATYPRSLLWIYSCIFKVFRAWNQQTSLRKRQKNLKKMLLNGLVKAINKHEELLMSKTLRALRSAKILNAKTHVKLGFVQAMVARNIKVFFFKLMIKKYKQMHFAKNLTALAQSHFKGCLRQKIM